VQVIVIFNEVCDECRLEFCSEIVVLICKTLALQPTRVHDRLHLSAPKQCMVFGRIVGVVDVAEKTQWCLVAA